MAPRIEFATASDGTRVAWASTGSGPVLVHMPGVPLSNLEAEWRIPVLQRAYGALAERVRLIQYDGRGTGRSQRDVSDASLDADMRDLDAVLDAVGAREVVLLGFYHSAMSAIGWAARHPDRVRGLALFGGALRGWDLMRGPGTQALLSLIERDWDTFVESVTHAWLGWPGGEDGRLAAEVFRASTSPTFARATMQATSEMDVTAEASLVRAPAIVLHRRDAQVIPLDVSRRLADALPNGRLEILPGASASLFFEATDEVVRLLSTFTIEPAAPLDPARGPRSTTGDSPQRSGLTPREREVLGLVAAGESNGQIAARLGLSINTIERHVSNTYRKIDARGRADATAWAIRHGVATSDATD
jgi:pimeloyl-ACP methyl ester carboxylesterase/DNA-binding CsgD family transcriptional regulator